ncbi:MAG: signal peptide peptidase SppA [Candidatus Woesearchaeota archaeon]
MKNRWIIVVLVLFVLGFFSIIAASILGLMLSPGSAIGGNVALIPIKGEIVSEKVSSFGSNSISSPELVDMIDKASQDDSLKAIVLEINSPGGSPVASDEITEAIKKANKTTIAWIRELGASGGYYIASGCDTIVAHPMALTGSIGVVGSYLEFAGFLQDYNVTYRRLVAGKYKDMGSPFKEMSEEEKDRYQHLLDTIHDMFIEEVATNRNLSTENVEEIATGEVLLGIDAKDKGLVDVLGSEDEVRGTLEKELNETITFRKYQQKMTFLQALSAATSSNSYWIGKGIGSTFKQEGIKLQ